MGLRHMVLPVAAALLACAGIGSAHADQKVVSGNGSLGTSVQLNFNIAISKYVALRVGSADGLPTDAAFNVGFSPVRPNGASQAYSGATPPTLVVSGAVPLTVMAFSNMNNTRLTCSLGPLTGFIALVVGPGAGGVPGTSDIAVSSGGPANVQHPGATLTACNGTTFSPLPMLSNLTGMFTYSATFNSGSLLAGNYGNTVTYTAATP